MNFVHSLEVTNNNRSNKSTSTDKTAAKKIFFLLATVDKSTGKISRVRLISCVFFIGSVDAAYPADAVRSI